MDSIIFTRESLYVQVRVWPVYIVLSLLINYHLQQGTLDYVSVLTKLGILLVFFNLSLLVMYRFYLRSLPWYKILIFISVVWLLIELVNWVAFDLFPYMGLFVVAEDHLVERDRLYWKIANQVLSMMMMVTALVLQVFYRKSAADYRAESELRHQLELEAKDLQLMQLMEQIFPHLTFNVLNDIKEEYKDVAPKAACQMQHLSDLLRYCVKQIAKGNTVVLVDREMEAIKWFLEIQAYRFKNSMVDYQVSGESWGQKVPPTLLLVLLENAFKYGLKNEIDDPIFIRLALLDNRVEFYCRNAIDHGASTKPSTGQGLINCGRRLAMLFPEKHVFEYAAKGNHYHVKLIIYQN